MTGSASAEPDYSDNSTNSTYAGQDILHSLQWTDSSGVSGYIFQFCNGTWTGADCGGATAELKEYYNTNDDTQMYIHSTQWSAQTFNSSVGFNIKTVGTKLYKATDGMINISIYPTNATGHPDTSSAPLISGEFNGSTLGASPGAWVNLTFDSSYPIAADTLYAIVMYVENVGGADGIDWRLDNTAASYARGSRHYSTNSGTAWILTASADMMFETYSEEGAGWVNDTFVQMTGTTNWSNVTKPVNTTESANIAWKVYANDTSDNWNTSATYSYLTTAPTPAAGVVIIEPGVIFDPASSNTNYTFHSQYNVTSISVNSTHIEINSAMLQAEPDTGTVNCTIYEYGTSGDHYRVFNITNTSAGWCYQETANISTTCGGLSTGTYTGTILGSDPWMQAFDGDWDTHAYNIEIYVNYTKPATAKSSSLWQVKDTDSITNTTRNISLSTCWDGYSDKVVLKGITTGAGVSYYARYYCHNSTIWVEVLNMSVGALRNDIYEEAMWWDLDATTVTITQGGYVLDDSVLIWRNKVRDGIAQLANATGFFSITQSLSTYNITSYLGNISDFPIITAYKLFTYGAFHNMTQLRDIYANITFYDTTPADTFYINTTWYKTNATGTYALDCCDTNNQTAYNNTETTITIPCYSNQTTVADNITAQMTVVDSAGNTNSTNATGTIKSHWWDDYWEWEENW